MNSATEQLAAFIANFKNDGVNEDAVYQSKIAVLDSIGVALAGFEEPVSKLLRTYVTAMRSLPEATIWGTNCRVSPLEAAMVNGAMLHALDYDDCNRLLLGHPSSVLVPTVFAVAEQLNSSGIKLLEGYMVGFQVVARLGKVLSLDLYEKGWHPTAVIGIMGAAASASYLFGLDYDRVLNALGIAASEASGIKKNFGTMTKPYQVGSAARKGIQAALLAQHGLASDPQALDGMFGYLDMFKRGEPLNLEGLEDLDSPLEIVTSGLVIKQYPCCGAIHSLLDNMIALKTKHQIEPEDVREIECRINPGRIPHTNRPRVRNSLEAKFSTQYCVAAALLDGRVSLEHFKEETVARPDIQNFMGIVHFVPTEDFKGFASEVVIHTADGKAFSSFLPEAKGSPALALTEEEVLQKFFDCASTLLTRSQAERVAAAIMKLEHEAVAENVVTLLSRPAERSNAG
jgi:2-methylcitrate dehydratase PrpD